MLQIDVCIPTFRRPYMLAKALNSLAEQQKSTEFDFKVIVVDNDKDGSAYETVKNFEDRLELIYAIEPLQNISAARNRAMQLCAGDWFAFLDDDAYVAPDWLEQLVNCAKRTHAEVILGPAWPTFPAGTSKALIDSKVLNIACPPADSSQGFAYDTCNSFFFRPSIERAGVKFDLHYGVTGGEDRDFFTRLREKDFKFAWASEAAAFAPLHSGRNTLLPTLRRKFNRGGIHAKIAMTNDRFYSPRQFAIIHAGFCYASMMVALRCVFLALGDFSCIRYLGKASFRLGQLFYIYFHTVSVEYGVRSARTKDTSLAEPGKTSEYR